MRQASNKSGSHSFLAVSQRIYLVAVRKGMKRKRGVRGGGRGFRGLGGKDYENKIGEGDIMTNSYEGKNDLVLS